jgi:hypothetical protein
MGSSASAEGDEGGPKKKPGEEEPKPKFEKGSENDCSNGPTKNRGYPIIGRDFPFCVLFYGGIFAFFTIAATSRGTGNADERKLIVGQDFMGNSCGARGNQNLFGGGDLEAFRYVYYTLNLTAVQGRIADALYPSSTSNVAGTDPTAFASMDPATLMTQYSGDPNSMISELKKYFHPVCVKSCSDQATGRSGYWEGYLDWATWQKNRMEASFRHHDCDCSYCRLFGSSGQHRGAVPCVQRSGLPVSVGLLRADHFAGPDGERSPARSEDWY